MEAENDDFQKEPLSRNPFSGSYVLIWDILGGVFMLVAVWVVFFCRLQTTCTRDFIKFPGGFPF